MESRRLTAARLVALFLLAWLLMHQPVLGLADSGGWLCGVPVLYGYIFAAWLLSIALVALTLYGAPAESRIDDDGVDDAGGGLDEDGPA